METSNDMSLKMAEDGETIAKGVDISTEKLTELGLLCEKLKEKSEKIELILEDLKKLKEEEKEISSKKIPDLFDEIGMSQIKLKTGETITIKKSFAAHVSEANKPVAFAWLEKNGHEAIIKHEITTIFKKGDLNERSLIEKKLKELGLTYKEKSSIHPMTLKSFIKEQMEIGSDIPQDYFGVYPIRETKIK